MVPMKIVVIRFSSLGDCTLLCPFLDHLKQHGATEITVLTKRRFVELFSAATGVDRVIALGEGAGWRGLKQVIEACRGGDLVIDAHNTMRSRLVARALGGAGARFGKHYGRKLRLIWLKSGGGVPRMSRSYSALGEALGFPAMTRPAGGLEVPRATRTRIRALLDHVEGQYVVVAPGSRWAMKRWGDQKYFELARRITNDYGHHIVLLGDGADAALTSRIAAALGDRVTDLAGRMSVVESAAAIEGALAFVGNDSGLMHLSEAVGVPVVAVFGPTVEGFGYFPSLERSRVVQRELACRPCSRNGSRWCPKGTHECMTGIAVEAVAEALDNLLADRTAARHIGT